MSSIEKFEIFAVDLPFRKLFKHAAAERASSYSLFVKCATDEGHVGYGECLPREYVTGESRDSAFKLLRYKVLPILLGMQLIPCSKSSRSWSNVTVKRRRTGPALTSRKPQRGVLSTSRSSIASGTLFKSLSDWDRCPDFPTT